MYGVDASAAQRVAQQCRSRGACVDVLNADPYAWESNARAVVVARAPSPVSRPKRRLDDDEEDCPLFMDAMPLGGVSSNRALSPGWRL